MYWPLTLLCGLAGALLGGWPGALLGALLGQALDRQLAIRGWRDLQARIRPPLRFEEVLFLCLGHLAKASGRVRQEHLQLARDLMGQYRLDEAACRQAMHDFNRGKQPNAPITAALRRLMRQDPAMAVELLDSCWRMALVGGSLSAEQQRLLNDWAQLAGLAKPEQQRMHQRHRPRSAQARAPVAERDLLAEAAALLQASLDDDEASIRRAYRRQLSRHHPDKLQQQGASAEQVAGAGERIRAIQEAWERLRRYRGFR